MNINYILGPYVSIASGVLSCGIIRHVIRNNIYETGIHNSDYHVLRDEYEKLTTTQKVVNGLAQVCLAALISALIHVSIIGLGMILFKEIKIVAVQNYAIIGAISGAILGTLYEPTIGDFYYYHVLRNPYTKGSEKFM